MNLPMITIVTASIQPIEDFRKTAESIERQIIESNCFEWIVVVGNYYEEYRAYLDSLHETLNINLFYQDPSGIYSAMNFGLEKARGIWVWFINCGDYFLNGTVLNLVLENINQQTDINLFASPVLYSTPQGFWFDVSHPRFVPEQGRVQAHVHHQGAIVRTNACRSIAGGFDVRLKFAADGKMLDSIASSSNYRVIDRILVVFTMGGASSKNFRETLLETKTYRAGTPTSLTLILKNRIREFLVSEFAWRTFPKFIAILLKPRDEYLRSLYSTRS